MAPGDFNGYFFLKIILALDCKLVSDVCFDKICLITIKNKIESENESEHVLHIPFFNVFTISFLRTHICVCTIHLILNLSTTIRFGRAQ